MIKRLIGFLAVINFTIYTMAFVNAEPVKSDNPEEFTKEFLCNKMYTIVTKNIDAIDKYYSNKTISAQKYMIFTKQNLLEDYLLAYSLNDYAIEKVEPHVQIIDSGSKGTTATVEAYLKTVIYWNASNALGEPITGIKCEQHLLVLCRENGKWKITADKYMTDRIHSDEAIKDDLHRMTKDMEKLKKQANESVKRAKRSMPARLTLTSSERLENEVNYSTSEFYFGQMNEKRPEANIGYSRDGAYNWASTYWRNYSRAFVNLGDQAGEGGDCTNFVSQCLRAGGAQNDKTGSYQWYYDNKGTSKTTDDSYPWTWSTAKGLNYILLGNYRNSEYGPKGIEKIINSDAEYSSTIGEFIKYGDIIQYEWSKTSNLKHSAVIVDMVYNSAKERYEPVISTHTIDAWYLPWTKNAYKTHFVHITGVN